MTVESTYRFARIPEWILFHPDLNDVAVRVYGVLDRYDGRECFPALETVGKRIGKSEDTVRRAIRALEAAMAVIVEERTIDGRQTSNRYILAGDTQLDGPWSPRESATLPVADLPGTGVAEVRPEREQDKREQEEPSSSLRSDGDVREESGSDDDARGAALPAPKIEEPGRRMATAYWDAFVAASGGVQPPTKFLNLMSVARAALKGTGLTEEEVIAGMLATKVMTGVAVVKEAVRIRRERENRPATGQISQIAVELVNAWFDWHDERCTANADRVHFHGKLTTLQALTTMIGWPSMSTAEVGARFGGFARAHGPNRLPNLDDLKAVPLGSHPLRPDDLNAVQTFERYANGPRLTA